MKCQICKQEDVAIIYKKSGTLCNECEKDMTQMFLHYNGLDLEQVKQCVGTTTTCFIINYTCSLTEWDIKEIQESDMPRFNFDVAVRIKEILDRNQLLKQLIQKFGISGTRKFLKDTGNGNGKLDSICACESCVGEDYEFESMYADILNYEESK